MPLSPPAIHPSTADVPVLISVPHAGRDYPDSLVALSKTGRVGLDALEDPRVDELVAPALAQGIGAVVARAPRAAVAIMVLDIASSSKSDLPTVREPVTFHGP